MAGPRGRQHRGRSTTFPDDKAVRATAMLQPGEDVRREYEELVLGLGISGAEVVRKAIGELHRKHSEQIAENLRAHSLKEAS